MRVIMFDIDTLRSDHLGCYGYGRNTSPAIDSVAAEGVRFEDYYCPNAPCLPSRASLITGRYGIRNGVVGHGGTAADLRLQGESRHFTDDCSENGLFMQFRRAGMHTVSFSTFAERHSAWWFNAGFNECFNVGGRGGESAEAVTPHVLDWIERSVFYSAKGVTIVFNTYDIAPYSAGEQTFFIPYDLVKPYLNDYGLHLLELDT